MSYLLDFRQDLPCECESHPFLLLQSRLRFDGCEYQQIKARCAAWLARRALPIFFLFNLLNVAFSWAKISLALFCDPFHLYDCIWDDDDDQLALYRHRQ